MVNRVARFFVHGKPAHAKKCLAEIHIPGHLAWKAAMSINDQIRKRIRKIANEQDLTFRAWSESAGLGPNSISQFLNGESERSITIDTLEAMANTAGVPLTTLINGSNGRLDVDLLRVILELTFATHPDPAANPDLTAKVAAAMYLTALDRGIGPKDRESLAFAAELLSRESSR